MNFLWNLLGGTAADSNRRLFELPWRFFTNKVWSFRKRFWVLIVALLAISLQASAVVVVFDNGGPNQVSQVRSDFGGAFSPDSQAGNLFVLANSQTLTGVNWWGSYASNHTPDDDFTIRCFDVIGEVIDTTPVFEFTIGPTPRYATGLVSANGRFEIFSYSVNLTLPLNLEAGPYLLSIANNTPTSTFNDWGWSTSDEAGGHSRSSVDGPVETAPWRSRSHSFAFQLVRVPEPAPVALLALALFWLLVMRRKSCRLQ